MTSVFLNGAFVERDDARIGAFDAGLLHGVGLFETMSARADGDGVVVQRLDEHLERLKNSARDLGLTENLRTGPLGEAVLETVKRSGLERARVRLTVTGGDLNLLETKGRSQHTPTVMVTAQPATVYPGTMFEQGVMASLADARANPLDPMAGHKTLNYWWRLRELQSASAKGAAEALVLSVSNHICSGCVSNMFVVKDGSLVTPTARGEEEKGALPSPVLPGITRAAVIEAAKAQGIECERRLMTIDDLLGADEVLLTNSSWGVLPVVRVEAEAIGDGKPGPIGQALSAAVE